MSGFGSFEARCFVDTGPWWSGRWPRRPGVGWTGKNTCLIHPKLGSFGFLAVLVTSLEVSTERAGIAHVDFAGSMYGLNPVPFGETSNYADFARLRLRCLTAAESCRRCWKPARPER